jgi:hypothetical protein
MKRLAFLLVLALASGCASVERPKPLTGAEIAELARSGANAKHIIAELQRTDTVLMLSASDFVRLHEAGVPPEALDYLQQRMIAEIRLREYHDRVFWHGPLYRGHGFSPCPPGRWRGYGPWGC